MAPETPRVVFTHQERIVGNQEHRCRFIVASPCLRFYRALLCSYWKEQPTSLNSLIKKHVRLSVWRRTRQPAPEVDPNIARLRQSITKEGKYLWKFTPNRLDRTVSQQRAAVRKMSDIWNVFYSSRWLGWATRSRGNLRANLVISA